MPTMTSQLESGYLEIKSNDTIQSRLGRYLKNQLYSDVTLKVGKDSKVIYGYKFALMPVSEVFVVHFSHEGLDKREIILEDDYDVMLSILSFIYTGSTRLHMNNLFDVLVVAHKYMLT